MPSEKEKGEIEAARQVLGLGPASAAEKEREGEARFVVWTCPECGSVSAYGKVGDIEQQRQARPYCYGSDAPGFPGSHSATAMVPHEVGGEGDIIKKLREQVEREHRTDRAQAQAHRELGVDGIHAAGRCDAYQRVLTFLNDLQEQGER